MSGYAFTPDRFTDLGGIPVVSSRFVPDGQWLLAKDAARGAGTVVFVGEHVGEAAEAITAELVACTLGVRRRPELLVRHGMLERLRRALGLPA